jgi:ParB family chromosome partitioning protein
MKWRYEILENIADKYLVKKFQDKEQVDNNVVVKNDENKIIELGLDKLIEFRKQQPFSMYNESKKEEMKESIEKFGILTPIIVRPIENGKYEIISGHNRVECSKELEKKTIPARIINVDDDEAILIMLETNLCTRDSLSPIEKGKAYKLRLEILKKKRREKVENSEDGDFSHKWEKYSSDEITEQSEESKTQIYRYISLTSLNAEFQRLIENETINVTVGAEIASLNEEQQDILYLALDDTKHKLKVAEIQKIKTLQDINYKSIIDIFENKKVKNIKFTGKLNKKVANKYKDKFNNDNDFTSLIDKLLEEYFEKER